MKSGAVMPIRQLLKLRGFPAIMVSSVITITALDLLVIYLPLLGAERQIDANNIGLLLTVRSFAALVSRSFYVRLIHGMGRTPLTLASMLGSAAGFLVLAIPLSLPIMYAVLIALGFAMGIASTLTISSVVHLAPPHAYGTALTLRMTGNRAGQIIFPALAGLLAAATGVAGILLAIGLGLAASGIAVAATQAHQHQVLQQKLGLDLGAHGAEHAERHRNVFVQKAAADPFAHARIQIEIAVVAKRRPMAVRLGQQIHQCVDVLPRYVHNRKQDRGAGYVGQETIRVEIIGKLPRKIRTSIENLNLRLAGALYQEIWGDGFAGIEGVQMLEEISTAIVE
jgi:hypothetical protein